MKQDIPLPSAHAVVIVSRDKDFSAAIAEQVSVELGLSCQPVEHFTAKELPRQPALIITSETEPHAAPCPVLRIKSSPFHLPQLLADVAVQLNDSAPLGPDYHLHIRHKQLTHLPSGKKADLTDKEAQLLQQLAVTTGTIPKEQLLKDIWGIETALDTHTLETHIYRLRGKCKDLAGDELIEARDGGYKLQDQL